MYVCLNCFTVEVKQSDCFQIRNLTRLIWINVALPPTDEQPPHAKGKTPVTDLTEGHLRQRKTHALKLCLSFAIAVKHYLREEDGTHWPDYVDALPASFSPLNESGYITPRTVEPGPYTFTRSSSKACSQEGLISGRSSPGATKRVRVKRSKVDLVSQTTPLLNKSYRNLEVNQSMPLPLAWVFLPS